MSDKALRIGFIGAGAICDSRHLPGLAKVDDVEIVAVCNRSEASGQKVADKWKIPDVETDWHKLVARDDLDAIFIGTWPYMHLEMSRAVLESGKHCFCQARMCMNLDEAKQMVAAAKANPKLVNMICPPPTRMPFEPWIKKMLADGELGDISLVSMTFAAGMNLAKDKVSWRERVEFSGKQVMAMGIFSETLNAIVGPYESLSADVSTPIPTKTDEDGNTVKIEIPQVVTITGKLASGALAVEHHMGLATDKTTGGSELVIWGSKGTIRYEFGSTIQFAKAGEELKDVDVPANLQRDWLVEEDFINAIRAANAGQSWSVSPDFEEGLLYMQKVEAVHESAATGKAVTLSAL